MRSRVIRREGLESQHTSLAIYILMRADVLASRCGIKSKQFGRSCKPLAWKHRDIFLMCLSSSQILSAYILHQDSLPASYKSFLNKHGGKDAVILQGVKDIASGKAFTNLHTIEKYYKTVGVDVKLDPNMKVPCSIVHGNQSCGGHVISFLGQAYKRALPVYFPVYLEKDFYKGLLQYCQRFLLALQDQACFFQFTVHPPGCGHAFCLGSSKDVTFQWWPWERSHLALD